MPELRKVQLASDYWHVVDDDEDNRQIIGSLLESKEALLPWRAEFAPFWGAPEDLAVGHFKTEEEAMSWLERKVEG